MIVSSRTHLYPQMVSLLLAGKWVVIPWSLERYHGVTEEGEAEKKILETPALFPTFEIMGRLRGYIGVRYWGVILGSETEGLYWEVGDWWVILGSETEGLCLGSETEVLYWGVGDWGVILVSKTEGLYWGQRLRGYDWGQRLRGYVWGQRLRGYTRWWETEGLYWCQRLRGYNGVRD